MYTDRRLKKKKLKRFGEGKWECEIIRYVLFCVGLKVLDTCTQGLLELCSVIYGHRIDYFIFNLFQTLYSQGDNSLSLGSLVFLFVVFSSCPHTKTYTINFWTIALVIKVHNRALG